MVRTPLSRLSLGMDERGRDDGFSAFFADVEPRLRRALVAAYGPEVGREALADALAHGWEHWSRVATMENPAGYLYRVGQSRARRHRRRPLRFPPVSEAVAPWIEPGLPAALDGLSEQQRVAVVLAHGYGCTQREIGDLLGVAPSTVQNHVERGMAKLRAALEVTSDA